MSSRFYLLAVLAACGAVTEAAPDGPPVSGYRGMLDATAPVQFGGDPYCTYTMVLRQIEIVLSIAGEDRVVDGQAQNLTVEEVIPTTPPCPFPPSPPSIHRYRFSSSSAVQDTVTVVFAADPSNTPLGTLVLEVTPSGPGYQASFDYHRTDQPAPLDWRVTGEVSLLREL